MTTTTRRRIIGPMVGADNEYVGATGHLAPIAPIRKDHVTIALDERYAHKWAGRIIEVHMRNLERIEEGEQ